MYHVNLNFTLEPNPTHEIGYQPLIGHWDEMHIDMNHRHSPYQFPSKAQFMGGHENKSDQRFRSTVETSYLNLN